MGTWIIPSIMNTLAVKTSLVLQIEESFQEKKYIYLYLHLYMCIYIPLQIETLNLFQNLS